MLRRRNPAAGLRLQFFPGVAGDPAALTGCSFILDETLGIMLACNFGGGRLAKHREDQLQVGHVIAQVLPTQSLEILILAWRHAESGL